MKTLLIFATLLLVMAPANAQEIASSTALTSGAIILPDAPMPVIFDVAQSAGPATAQTDSGQSPPTLPQTKRILGTVPNFRSVSADTKTSPQTARDKFKTGFQDSVDYSSFVFVGMQAGINQATNTYPAFRQAAAGYGRYYWHTFVDQADENLWVESIIPAVLHEDNRYYTLGHGGFFKRSVYSLSRAVITRNDNGEETFNAAEIVGAGAAAGIASTYYPGQYRTWTKTGQWWLSSVVIDSATFAAKEFWPDLNRAVFHRHE